MRKSEMSCGDGKVDPLEDCDFGLRRVFELMLPCVAVSANQIRAYNILANGKVWNPTTV